VADSFHMLSDIAALIIAFISVRMSPKSWHKNTYGWARAEVLGKTSLVLTDALYHSGGRVVPF
jgi:Co/Zn/Cd efflux system component